MDTAYVRGNPPPKQPYQVQYLDFWYLKLLVKYGTLFCSEVYLGWAHPLPRMLACKQPGFLKIFSRDDYRTAASHCFLEGGHTWRKHPIDLKLGVKLLMVQKLCFPKAKSSSNHWFSWALLVLGRVSHQIMDADWCEGTLPVMVVEKNWRPKPPRNWKSGCCDPQNFGSPNNGSLKWRIQKHQKHDPLNLPDWYCSFGVTSSPEM